MHIIRYEYKVEFAPIAGIGSRLINQFTKPSAGPGSLDQFEIRMRSYNAPQPGKVLYSLPGNPIYRYDIAARISLNPGYARKSWVAQSGNLPGSDLAACVRIWNRAFNALVTEKSLIFFPATRILRFYGYLRKLIRAAGEPGYPGPGNSRAKAGFPGARGRGRGFTHWAVSGTRQKIGAFSHAR